MGNIAKRLKKELRKNPHKAAALLMLSLVALVMWGPKFYRFVFRGPANGQGLPSASAAQALETSATVASRASGLSVPNPTEIAVSDLTKCSWKQVVIWKNSHREVTTEPCLSRDPFAPLMPPPESLEPPREESGEPAMAVNSALQCRGVVIGPRARWAIFDGQYLQEGQITTAEAGGRKFQLRVSRIETDHVLVEIEGKTVEYRFPQLGLR